MFGLCVDCGQGVKFVTGRFLDIARSNSWDKQEVLRCSCTYCVAGTVAFSLHLPHPAPATPTPPASPSVPSTRFCGTLHAAVPWDCTRGQADLYTWCAWVVLCGLCLGCVWVVFELCLGCVRVVCGLCLGCLGCGCFLFRLCGGRAGCARSRGLTMLWLCVAFGL